jgi:PIN domain nuclease of toxin-antitoxin system
LDIDFESLIKLLKNINIDIIDFNIDSLKVLFTLPFYKNHSDPTDRHIIATAIAKKRILVSGDVKFRFYTEDGLLFLEI